MKEIGGYIELDTYRGQMLHENGIKLNCGRNALAYLLQTKSIKKLLMPKFMCDSCEKVFKENQVNVQYYSVGLDFKPAIENRNDDEWLYLVNFYGQISNDYISTLGCNVIVDNAQAYFEEPMTGIDTLYTCRKFFGVADGAILYTDVMPKALEQDESFERMHFILGRFERTASEFYPEYVDNNHLFADEPIKQMSKLTENLLRAIDYDYVCTARTDNFTYLHEAFKGINRFCLRIPKGPFMYPLYIEGGDSIRKELQKEKIYIPTLWPAVFKLCRKDEPEYDMAKNILPLPVDQRYNQEDMEYLIKGVKRCIG